MSLEDLNDAVYRRDFKPTPAATPPVDPAAAPSLPEAPHQHAVRPSVHAWGDTPTVPLTPADRFRITEKRLGNRKRLALGLVAFLLALLAVLGFFGRRLLLFEPAKVSMALSGPETVATGETATLTIKYGNENWMGLSDAELTLYYPDSFHPVAEDGWDVALNRATKKIDVIPGGASGAVTLPGTFQAYDKRTALFRAVLRSSPRGITNPTEIESRFTVVLDATAIEIELVGPPSIVLGQPLEYVARYENRSTETLDNLRLVANYPVGFVPTSFEPQPITDETTWLIGTLAPGGRGQVSIKGEIRGSAGDARRLGVSVGKALGNGEFLTLASEEKLTRVTSPPLSVTLSVNGQVTGVIDPGEELAAVVNFKNNGDVGIRDIIATLSLDEALLDLAALDLPSGVVYDHNRQQATIRASEVPELKSLEPGEAGKIAFRLRVRTDVASLGRSNIELKTRVTLDSPDLPHGQNVEAFTPTSESVMKVSSPVNLDLKGYYFDSEFANSGPLPPKVGQETTYTFRLAALSTVNPLNEARLLLNLPTAVRFIEILQGDTKTVRYNDRTGEFIWTPGTVARGDLAAPRLVLRVGLTPPPGSAGQNINLVNGGSFTAKDPFTEETIELKLPNKTISLSEDQAISNQQNRIAE